MSDAFPERGRVSFLDQEIWIDMSPEILETHGLIKAEIGYRIVGLSRKERRGVYFPDRTLLTNTAVGLSTEAHSAFAFWETLQSGRLTLVPRADRPDQSRELQGTPDWVLEIVSDTSVVKDTQQLPDMYYRAGIPEYWLIDARGEAIDFRMLVRGPTGYVDAPRRGNWQTSGVFRRSFRLTRRPGPLGIWEYMLHMRRA
jgi:Uma2 family endonuclease